MPEAAAIKEAPAALAKGDRYIWGVYVFLLVVSLVELFSASSREVSATGTFGVLGPVVRHGALLLLGFGLVYVIQRWHYRRLIPLTYLFVLGSVGMMVYVLLFGDVINGARRSMSLLGFQLQPAEFIKLSAVLVISLVVSRNQQPKGVGVTDRGVWICAAAVLFFSGLLAKQGLTNTLLLMAISLSMMLIGGVKLKKLLIVVAIYIACGAVFVFSLGLRADDVQAKPTTEIVSGDGGVILADDGQAVEKKGRLATWIARISRFSDNDSVPKYARPITAENRQEMFAYMAQANGGIHGVMPGNSREAARLPLAFSDFIYAIVVEDLGFIGGVLVLLAYLCLLGRAAGLAARCSRAYPALLVIGMAVMIVLQALFHMAIVTGVAPVSGQPLPLISKGGSSILITSIAFGIMLSVSKYAVSHRSKRAQIKDEIEALPEDLRAENPTQL